MKKEINPSQLRQLIAQNKTEQVFKALHAVADDLSDTRYQDQLSLLEARWNILKTNQNKGILTSEEQGLERNRIHVSLMALMDEMNKDSITIPKPEITIPKPVKATATTTPKPVSPPDSKPISNPDPSPSEKVKKTLSLKSILTMLAAAIAIMAGIAEISGYSLRDIWEQKTPPKTKEIPSEEPADTTSTPVTVTPPPSNPPSQPSVADKVPEQVKEELPAAKAKLKVQIKTQKGDRDLTFKASEEVRLYFKVNRPCKLRTIYRLADSTLILLDNDRLVNKPETNQWVELGDGFEVAAPFGVEELYLFAQENDFPTLITEEKDGYTLIKEGLPSALSKTRGLKKKQVFAEDQLKLTTLKN